MLDFMTVSYKSTRSGFEVFPTFITRTGLKDLMIRGSDFYAIWDEDRRVWSTDEGDVIRLVDREIDRYIEEHKNFLCGNVVRKYMWDSDSGSIDKWHKYCQKQMRDSYHMLDEKLIFSNDQTDKDDYSSKRLNYPLEEGSFESWDRLVSVLYSPEERHKIEWAIGSIVTGDSKSLQKFMVLYGSAGTGKSTILNIVQKLFDGYYTVFDAKALGSANSAFALEPFRTNPLIAIQHDGDLSKIEDNTRLNSLVSHELMTVNEKFKSTYTTRFKCFLFMGTNKPVKITDGKSGLLRRLIDVTPTGNKLSVREYNNVMKKIDFELGAIAYHCMRVYEDDPNYYDGYTPTEMLGASNDFYNFVVDSYRYFKTEDGTSLKTAWERYKNYCEEAKIAYPFSQRTFREELKNYFENFDDGLDPEKGVKNYYSGFKFQKFETIVKEKDSIETEEKGIDFREQKSVLDDELSDCPAQYASSKGTPVSKWDNCTTRLRDIDTGKLHYVKVPENHIVIDFDIPDEKGEKSYEKNLEAASKWPPTYAELSKSGAGIHLHYIYSGDISELSRVYGDHIEVKVFTGNSSLRRMLTKCNNIPIAKISSGLPLISKGVKMVNNSVVQTEKGLRTTIKKCLNKEIHSSTASNVSFIFDVLEKAYESGMTYDVSDMRNAVYCFAASSTHQAEKCIKMVTNMHFKSEENENTNKDSEKPIAFYDIEVFPNLFVVNWKLRGEENPVVRMINPSSEEIEKLLQYRLIGFNNRRYDNHVIYARLMGYSLEQLYELSQKIISGSPNCFFSEAYNLSYTDIYDFASAGNKKSLKKLEIEMSNKARDPNSDMDEKIRGMLSKIKHQELGLPWDQPVPEELWVKVAEYCDNDVISTEAAFEYLSADWTARQILADLAGMSVNDSTNSLTTRIIFGRERNPQTEFNYRDLSKPVFNLDPDVREFLQEACPDMMAQTHGEEHSELPYFPGYEYKNGKSTYREIEVGEGGYVEAKLGMHGDVALLDVNSMHPHSTIAECLFGARYTRAYRDIVEGRVSIKHEAWDEVNNMLDGKLTKFVQRVINGEMSSGQLANALKTAINSVYGLTSAGFNNPFRDIRNKDNIVAKRGALFMIDLKYEVENRGFTVAHIKTDSIKIPDATPEIIQFVQSFGLMYGYTFEHEATYDRMCLVNDAVYIAKYKDAESCQAMYGYVPGDNKKHGGQWTATGKQFAVPYLFKTLFSKEPLVFSDMCETFSVTQGDLYLDMNEPLPDVTKYERELDKWESDYKKGKVSDTLFEPEAERLTIEIDKGHDYQFVGRVGQFTPVKEGCNGGVLYRIKDGKAYAAPGSSGFRWMESQKVESLGLENDVDRSFYDNLVTDAVKSISKYCDFEWFVSDDPYVRKPRLEDFMNIPEVPPGQEDVEELPFN